MPEIDEETLERILRHVLHEKRQVDEETHSSHHRYIDILIEKEERRKEAWRKFKLSFIGGLALALLGALSWVGTLVIESFRHGPPPGSTGG